ncbi:MAG: hypothetical protein L0387_29535 [Acidobacteria bacterium]|nr:hypothetical protein [Acidobacteriota bacterium]MCI0625738.1 hypothetical protein [Acidobacteriota bacterium]MCI0717457.1 hypothetical protein [Acidobacteriota bacterium]
MSNAVNAVPPYSVQPSIINQYEQFKYVPWMNTGYALDYAFSVNAPKTNTVELTKKDGSKESLSYTPGDFASMKAAADRLIKEGNEESKLEGSALMQEAYQILQLKQLELSLKQNLFNTIIQALQRAAG